MKNHNYLGLERPSQLGGQGRPVVHEVTHELKKIVTKLFENFPRKKRKILVFNLFTSATEIATSGTTKAAEILFVQESSPSLAKRLEDSWLGFARFLSLPGFEKTGQSP